jgi:hypothetical protein
MKPKPLQTVAEEGRALEALYLRDEMARLDILALTLLLLLLAGCASAPSGSALTSPLGGLLAGSAPTAESAAPLDPMIAAALSMTRWGVLLIVGGLIFGAFTRFRTGWGLSLAAAGILIILLAWTFRHPWTPWLGLLTILAYAGYKIYNRLNPNVPTEPLML